MTTAKETAPGKLAGPVGFIGGGNMAEAMIRGMLAAGIIGPERIWVSDVRETRLAYLAERFGVRTTEDNTEVARQAAVLVLAVKPQILMPVLEEIKACVSRAKLVISIVAGIPLAAIEEYLGAELRLVRVMPNTPALVLCGATAFALGRHTEPGDKDTVRVIFESVGEVVRIDESLIDAVTGLSGSGPAYLFLIIEALSDAGVKVGIHREQAQLLAAQTVMGSAKLLLETGEHPGRLKDMVTSPGGTAIAGLHVLEAGGLRTTLMTAVETATRRSRELGEEAIAAAKNRKG